MTNDQSTDQHYPLEASDQTQSPHGEILQDRRRKRIDRALEYVDDALELEDPIEASLGAMTGDFMVMATQLSEAIRTKLGTGAPTLEQLQKVAGAIDLNLKVARQIDRQLQLRNRGQERRNQ